MKKRKKQCGHPGRFVFVITNWEGGNLTFCARALSDGYSDAYWCAMCGALRFRRDTGTYGKWMRPGVPESLTSGED